MFSNNISLAPINKKNIYLGAFPAVPKAPSIGNLYLPIPAKVFRPQRSVCLVAVSATGYHSAAATVRASLWPTLH